MGVKELLLSAGDKSSKSKFVLEACDELNNGERWEHTASSCILAPLSFRRGTGNPGNRRRPRSSADKNGVGVTGSMRSTFNVVACLCETHFFVLLADCEINTRTPDESRSQIQS